MKAIVRILFLVVLAVFAGSCRTQKDTLVPSVKHQMALDALQAGRFLVKLDAIYPSSASPYQHASRTEYRELHESYFSVRDGAYVSYVSFEDRGFLADEFPARKREGLHAEVSGGKKQRNGEICFRLRVYGEGLVSDKRIAVFLDGKSNRCYVKITSVGGSPSNASMSGHVYPLEKAEPGV